MLPAILKNYAQAQLPNEVVSILEPWPPRLSSIANQSNLSMYGSTGEQGTADSKAVIIVTRYEMGRWLRRTSDVYRGKVFEWSIESKNDDVIKDQTLQVPQFQSSATNISSLQVLYHNRHIDFKRRISV